MTTESTSARPQRSQSERLLHAAVIAGFINVVGVFLGAWMLEESFHGVPAARVGVLVVAAAVPSAFVWLYMWILERGATTQSRAKTVRLAWLMAGWRLPVRPRRDSSIENAAMWIGIVAVVTALHVAAVSLLDAVLPVSEPNAAEFERQQRTNEVPLALLPLSVIMLATVEGVFFRGPVITLFDYAQRVPPRRRRRIRYIGAAVAVLSTVCFALAHLEYSPPNVATAAIGGVIYLALALASKSILPAIAVHAAYNLVLIWPHHP